jgi:CRP-like cAMP-binding protein
MPLTTPPMHVPGQNQLLAALPAQEFAHLFSKLELVLLPLGTILFRPGDTLLYTYFPTTAIASLHYVMESGASAEFAGVGCEGLVGMQSYLGGGSTTSSALVQTAGYAYRIDSRALTQEFYRSNILQRLLLRYTQALITQISQSVVCNRHHSVEQQLSRWLLSTLDRIPSGELVMTQELIASMLGVRREGITQIAGKFQEAGYIRYRRGHISVLNRAGLESHACECYAILKKELQRLKRDVNM